MPKAKERKPNDKIKNQGKRKARGLVQNQARRVMTAKMRKELAQQKRSASGSTSGETVRDTSPTAEAVEQMEQTAGAAVQEVGHRTKQGVSQAVTKVKQERRKIKERQDQLKEGEPSPKPLIPETPEAPAPEPNRAAPRKKTSRTPPRSKPQAASRTDGKPLAPKEKPAPSIRSKTPKTRPERGPEALAIPNRYSLNHGQQISRPPRQRRESVCGNGLWTNGRNRPRSLGKSPPRQNIGNSPRSAIMENPPQSPAAPPLQKNLFLLIINLSIHPSRRGPEPPPF